MTRDMRFAMLQAQVFLSHSWLEKLWADYSAKRYQSQSLSHNPHYLKMTQKLAMGRPQVLLLALLAVPCSVLRWQCSTAWFSFYIEWDQQHLIKAKIIFSWA
jgi:hypothetical protein